MPGEQFPCHRRRYTSCPPGQELDSEFRLQILNAFCGGRNGDAAFLGSTCHASALDSCKENAQGCPIRQVHWPIFGKALFSARTAAGSRPSLARAQEYLSKVSCGSHQEIPCSSGTSGALSLSGRSVHFSSVPAPDLLT